MTTEEHYQTLLVVWDPFQNIPVIVYILMHTWGKSQTNLTQTTTKRHNYPKSAITPHCSDVH